MSTSDRLLLILHVGFAIFTLGPLTAATMASPRYIRKGDVVVTRYLNRTTRLYGLGTLGIFLFGLLLANGDLARFWMAASITLFVVALVLLLLVERDQRKAVHLLEVAAAEAAPPVTAKADDGERVEAGTKAEEKPTGDEPAEPEEKPAAAPRTDVAEVERGRIASISGVIALIWLVILVLMVWNGSA